MCEWSTIHFRTFKHGLTLLPFPWKQWPSSILKKHTKLAPEGSYHKGIICKNEYYLNNFSIELNVSIAIRSSIGSQNHPKLVNILNTFIIGTFHDFEFRQSEIRYFKRHNNTLQIWYYFSMVSKVILKRHRKSTNGGLYYS